MDQYPYSLVVKSVSPGGKDENGRVIQGVENGTTVSACRDEVKRGDRTVTVGGKVTTFSAFVFCPLDCPDIMPGTSIEVKDGNTVRIAGDVKYMRRGYLHCRIWL